MFVVNVLFDLAIMLAALSLVAIYSSSFLPYRWTKQSFRILFTILVVSFAFIAFWAEPSRSDDLYRHYVMIDGIRSGNFKLNNGFLIMEALFGFIALFQNNGWLPAITVLLVGFFLYQIMLGNVKQSGLGADTKIYSSYFVCFMGFCSIFAIVSGIRSALAFGIWAYAYFTFYNRNNKRFWILAVASMLLHLGPILPTTLILITSLYKRSNRNSKLIIVAIMVFWPVMLKLLALVFLKIPVSYFQMLAGKILIYKGERLTLEGIHLEWFILYLCSAVLLKILWNRLDQHYRDFMMLLFLCVGSSLFSYTIFLDRMNLLVGYMFFPIVYHSQEKKSSRFIMGVVKVVSIFCLLYYFNAMIAHITFNGIDFYDIIRGR